MGYYKWWEEKRKDFDLEKMKKKIDFLGELEKEIENQEGEEKIKIQKKYVRLLHEIAKNWKVVDWKVEAITKKKNVIIKNNS